RMIETDSHGADAIDRDVVEQLPQRVQSGAKDSFETSIGPHERTFVVLQIQHFSRAFQRAALDDDIKIAVTKQRVTNRNAFDDELERGIEEPVATRAQDDFEFAILI